MSAALKAANKVSAVVMHDVCDATATAAAVIWLVKQASQKLSKQSTRSLHLC